MCEREQHSPVHLGGLMRQLAAGIVLPVRIIYQDLLPGRNLFQGEEQLPSKPHEIMMESSAIHV